MAPYPTNLARLGPDLLRIAWSDGVTQEFTARALREACPCASCREKRMAPPAAANPLAVLKPEETRPLAIQTMTPVGNYAYSIEFSDGHDLGIFTLTHLREVGKAV